MFDQNLIIGLIVLAVVVFAVYSYAPKFRGMLSGLGVEGFANGKNGKPAVKTPAANGGKPAGADAAPAMKALAMANPAAAPAPPAKSVAPAAPATAEAFSDYAGFNDSATLGASAGAGAPGCYPRKQLNASELLPNDANSQWAAVNPQGSGDLQGKNFLSAGALIGVNTVGQSLRNANLQLRSEPPNIQTPVGPWLQSTIEPDLQRRPLE